MPTAYSGKCVVSARRTSRSPQMSPLRQPIRERGISSARIQHAQRLPPRRVVNPNDPASLNEMKKSSYTLKFYQGRKLIAEHTWDANESFLDDILHDAENLIDEAIACNPTEIQKVDQS